MNGFVENELRRIDKMQDGFSFEEYVMSLLKNNGFSNVILTEKTGDYGADIIANLNDERIAFQCKCSSSSVGIKAVQQVISGKLYYKCQSAIVVTNNEFTFSAISLAHVAGVALWGRTRLSELIKPRRSYPSVYDYDDVFMDALEYTLSKNKISTAELQTKYNVGYGKATLMIDKMEQMGIVGPHMGSRPRDVLLSKEQFSFGVSKEAHARQQMVQDDHDFRKIYWGMDREQVESLEGSPDSILPNGSFLYVDRYVINRRCDYLISFNKNAAYQGMYLFSKEHNNIPDYITDYYNISNIVSRKYGEPFFCDEIWEDDDSKGIEDKETAFSNGKLYYLTAWETENTSITLTLFSDSNEITCSLSYITTNENLKPDPNEVDIIGI